MLNENKIWVRISDNPMTMVRLSLIEAMGDIEDAKVKSKIYLSIPCQSVYSDLSVKEIMDRIISSTRTKSEIKKTLYSIESKRKFDKQ